MYLNSFSGEATTEFPSTLQMARGGVCLLIYCWTSTNLLYHLNYLS